jgi:hypothetical protein
MLFIEQLVNQDGMEYGTHVTVVAESESVALAELLDKLKERDKNLHKLTVEDPDFARVLEDEDWDGEMACYLLDALFDSLDVAAPDGYYFSAHEGDGCCYGFWKNEPE